jgi:glycosyltransferase involved in cell wall biosynthesis
VNAVRVAFVDHVGATAGGAEHTLATLLKHLPREAIEPSIVLFEDGAFAQRLRSGGWDVAIVPVHETILRSTRERLRFGAAFAAYDAACRLAGVLRRGGVDVVYTNSMKAHLVGALAARLAGVPCVMHFHDMIDGKALAALRVAARLGSRARIACSQIVADTIAAGPTSVIYAPLDLDHYARVPERVGARAALGLPNDLPVVSLVGRINRWKGHDRFLRVAARVNESIPARFVIAGAPVFRDADFVPELHALADRLGLHDRVAFLPWTDDATGIYAASDVNCNCSTREAFGRAVIEAAACGTPSVCFDDSGAAETLIQGVTGRAVPAGDEEAFAAAIVAYLRDPERLRAARIAARAGISRFDAAQIASQTVRVIDAAVA